MIPPAGFLEGLSFTPYISFLNQLLSGAALSKAKTQHKSLGLLGFTFLVYSWLLRAFMSICPDSVGGGTQGSPYLSNLNIPMSLHQKAA